MKFALDFRIRVGDDVVNAAEALKQIAQYEEQLRDPSSLEGALVCKLDGDEHCGEQFDPILRLADQWIRKLPWVLAGDTETVAYRNSEHCFAFVPAGESVEFSFFVGSESEIEEYMLEPTHIRLDMFATESIKMAESLLALVKAVDPGLTDSNDDCRELAGSLEEGRKAWRDYQLRQRR